MLEDCQGIATLLLKSCTGALPGHRHTEAPPGYWHSDEVLSHRRHRARVQVLCEEYPSGSAGVQGHQEHVCAWPGVLGQGSVSLSWLRCREWGCHQGTSAVPGLRLLQQPPGYSHTDRTRVPSKQHCQGTAAWGDCWVQSHCLGYRVHRFSRLSAGGTATRQYCHTTAQVPSLGPTHWPAEPEEAKGLAEQDRKSRGDLPP